MTLEELAKEIRRHADEVWELGRQASNIGAGEFELSHRVKMAADELHSTARMIEAEIMRRSPHGPSPEDRFTPGGFFIQGD